MRRAWVNQPSTLQPLHKYHGLNVLAPEAEGERTVTVYPTSGVVSSMMVPVEVLSDGWTTRCAGVETGDGGPSRVEHCGGCK